MGIVVSACSLKRTFEDQVFLMCLY